MSAQDDIREALAEIAGPRPRPWGVAFDVDTTEAPGFLAMLDVEVPKRGLRVQQRWPGFYLVWTPE